MQFIAAAPKVVRLTLARDRVRSLKRGHPWIFGDHLQSIPDAPSGSLALLRDREGKVISQGIYDPKSHLAFRSCALNPERLDDELVVNRLMRAWDLRRRLFDSATTAYRLLNGEGDGLPGLIADVYGEHLVMQLDGAGPANFWNLEGIAGWIRSAGGPPNAYRKQRSGESSALAACVAGKIPSGDITFKENGILFAANLIQGHKTGFFLDQRDNRQRVRKLAAERRVLNLFSYTGGFSLYAASGGAAQVTTVDYAKPAIEAARENWHLNGFEESRHEALAVDAFEFLEKSRTQKRRWDLVVVDPPSFAPGKHHIEKASAAYLTVLTQSIEVTESSGILCASSCSSHITPEMFLELCEEAVSKARRRATVLGIYGQPEDHPFPLACRELQYLKFVVLEVQ